MCNPVSLLAPLNRVFLFSRQGGCGQTCTGPTKVSGQTHTACYEEACPSMSSLGAPQPVWGWSAGPGEETTVGLLRSPGRNGGGLHRQREDCVLRGFREPKGVRKSPHSKSDIGAVLLACGDLNFPPLQNTCFCLPPGQDLNP